MHALLLAVMILNGFGLGEPLKCFDDKKGTIVSCSIAGISNPHCFRPLNAAGSCPSTGGDFSCGDWQQKKKCETPGKEGCCCKTDGCNKPSTIKTGPLKCHAHKGSKLVEKTCLHGQVCALLGPSKTAKCAFPSKQCGKFENKCTKYKKHLVENKCCCKTNLCNQPHKRPKRIRQCYAEEPQILNKPEGLTALDDVSCDGGKRSGKCPPGERGTPELKWYYNAEKQVCVAYTFGGCGDMTNVFMKKSDCQNTCYPADGSPCSFPPVRTAKPAPIDDSAWLQSGPENMVNRPHCHSGPNQLKCPEGHVCRMGAFFPTCCDAAMEKTYDQAFADTCPNGRLSQMQKQRSRDAAIYGDNCADLLCPNEFQCVQVNSLFAKCCRILKDLPRNPSPEFSIDPQGNKSKMETITCGKNAIACYRGETKKTKTSKKQLKGIAGCSESCAKPATRCEPPQKKYCCCTSEKCNGPLSEGKTKKQPEKPKKEKAKPKPEKKTEKKKKQKKEEKKPKKVEKKPKKKEESKEEKKPEPEKKPEKEKEEAKEGCVFRNVGLLTMVMAAAALWNRVL